MKPVPTRTFEHHQVASSTPGGTVRKAGLGELAIQEVMNGFALATPPAQGVFLFEDHKIARVSFLLPEGCQKVSTRAFLIFLEGSGLIASARELESRAIQARPGFFHRLEAKASDRLLCECDLFGRFSSALTWFDEER